MPVLTNPRHEQFAALIAGGMRPAKAYSAAGFAGQGAAQSASRLAKTPVVAARIAELRQDLSSSTVQRAVVDRAWVLARLRENVERSMQVVEVNIRSGKPTGVFKYDGMVANRALELLGKELGMFRDAVDLTQKWDGDPKKLSRQQLERMISEYDKEAAAAANEELAKDLEEAKKEAAAGLGSDTVQ
jgi:hypothetical protein